MDLTEFFGQVEETMLARFREAGFVDHAGEKGLSRENILREFLGLHLPKRYGITKGEIITRDGHRSPSHDVIIYDVLQCPLLYASATAVIPIEGVYGIIEVKSRLSKAELEDATGKIAKFKELAPRELSIVKTREYVTLDRPSRPFGLVFAFSLAENSLDSLTANWAEINDGIHLVDQFANLVAVLGSGLLYYEGVDFLRGEKHMLLDTDDYVEFLETAKKREKTGEITSGDMILRIIQENRGAKTFGRLLVYLMVVLERMKLVVPDLGRYMDPSLPMRVRRE
jgi:hypothetical protein